jgi:peptide/nickel transport system substrate-binding protein
MAVNRGIDRRTFVKGAGALGLMGATGGLGSFLAGCGGGDDEAAATTAAEAAEAVRGGRAILATVDKPVNMDPADAQLYSSMQVYQNIFHKLVNVDADFKFVPGLASEWTQDDDKTWTLKLVENAVFHNGEPFTAKDVKFSFDRLPKHANGIFVQAWKETEVVDDHTVRFHLSQPYGAVVATLAAIGDMVNEKAVTSADPKLKPVGTGPYRMTEWVQDDHVTLERWDQFFKPDKPYLDEVVFRAIGDDTVRLTGLQTGELDWIQRVPAQRIEELEGSSDLVSSAAKPYLPDMVMFNCSKPPFNDPRVRQAVAWLIDRDEIVELVWFGSAVAATEAVSDASPWYSGQNPYEGGPDPDRAKSLLKQAGQENLRITFAGQPQVATQVRTGEVLRSQLAKGGIEMRIQNYEPAQWFEQLATKKYDLTSTYWSATLDPAHLYFPIGFSKSPWNFPSNQSKKIDAALEKFAFTTDQAIREAAYPDVVQAVAEEAPIIFLTNESQRYWTKPTLHGAAPLPSIEIRAEDLWRES